VRTRRRIGGGWFADVKKMAGVVDETGTMPAKSFSSNSISSPVSLDGSDGAQSHNNSSNNNNGGGNNGGGMVKGLVIKAACLVGGAFLLRKLTKTTTRRDHARMVAQCLTGEKYSTEQASRDPMTYFNLRYIRVIASASLVETLGHITHMSFSGPRAERLDHWVHS
jgi:hypothetical protein